MRAEKLKLMISPKVDGHGKRLKDYDLRIGTWNVRSLYRTGASTQLADALNKCRADITAIQEMRWLGQGCKRQASCDIYYSCHMERHEFGCGFVVSRRLRHLVSEFNPVNERIATIRIKAKFYNLSLICAHAPTEDKDDAVKDAFYAKLEDVYDRCPAHDAKIVLGDFNAKIGQEDIFGPTVGRFSLHENTTPNGLRLIDFAAARNMVVCSTRFQHLDIHKATWMSPDRTTRNQIDHIVIDGRHVSSVLDVRTFRGPNIDSDHYLVAAKVRLRISNARTVRPNALPKFDVRKLRAQETSRNFTAQLADKLSYSPSSHSDIGGLWAYISHSLRTTAETVLGFERPPKRNQWYDEECREANAAKNAAYRKTLQSAATRAIVEDYKEMRRKEKRLFRRKKREQERREREEIEMCRSRNDARNFYKRVKRLTEGFKPRVSSCKDQNGNLVTDTQGMLRLWRQHFYALLRGDDDDNSANMEDVSAPINDDGVEIPLPTQDEVEIVIQRLKNNKAAGPDGLSAELFKAGGNVLVGCMRELLCKIWVEESMPNDWNLSVLCPVLKKGDPTDCANYRGISLLPIAYKVLTSVLCDRLKPFAMALIGPYQCGFRPGKSTIDQIFTLRQILEKTREKQIDTHHLFVDYKAAFDSPIRDRVYAAMSELGIPTKLVRLCRMTLCNSCSSVKVGNDLSEPFNTVRGFRQGDPLSCNLFNFVMESVLRKAGVHRNGTIFYKSVQLLAYADDIDIIGRTKRDVTAAFSAIERESIKMGLAVNEGKTKYMVATSRDVRRIGSQISVDNYTFDVVKEFIYLGTAVTTVNDVSLEIKRRITLANRCYYGLNRQLSSRDLSRATKLRIYKSLILPVLLYGAEAWTISRSDAEALGVFERKVLRKIFGPVRIADDFRSRTNLELYEILNDMDVVQRINTQRLRWLGHVVRMEEDVPARQVLDAKISGRRRRGRPCLRWMDQVEEILSSVGVSNWRRRARSRGAWKDVLRQAEIRHTGC